MPLRNSLLDDCARAIADNRPRNLYLYPLLSTWHDIVEGGVEYLAERVEEFSGGRLTVRRADSALFAAPAKGPALHVVACPIDTPQETVTELNLGMVLIEVGPYQNGLDMPARRAAR